MSVSLDGGAFSAPVAYASSVTITGIAGDGTHTVSVLVADRAGNTVVITRAFVLDSTPPAIASSLTAPANGAWYDVSQRLVLTYSATDASSGVASVKATIDGVAWATGGTVVGETLAAGIHTVVVTATDTAGNTSTSTSTITVRATVPGLQAAVSYGVSSGWITSSSVAATLQSDLSAAASALAANNHTAAKAALATFAKDAGNKAVLVAYATLLKGWAADLSATL
jgi:hypothetical protein